MVFPPTNDDAESDYRFGPYKLSPTRQTLYRDGIPVRIQELPFRALVLLVEVQDRVVSKNELRDRLWGGDTFVEVDQNLYVVVRKLRDLLGDDAVTPRFIKTVSGRGYQFIAAVNKVSSGAVLDPLGAVEADLPSATEPTISARKFFRSAHSRQWIFLAIAAMVSAVCFTVFWEIRGIGRQIYWPNQSLMIGDLDGKIQDSRFNQMLPFLVKLKVQQSSYLTLLPERKVAELKRDDQFSGGDGDLRACSKLGAALLLRSRAVPNSRGYRIELMALRCSDGKIVGSEHTDADSETSILGAVDLVTYKMRQRLGEPASSLQRFNAPLVESTTSSLAALKEFTEGERKLQMGNGPAAISNFKMAVDLDPTFALAYARLGTIYQNSQQPAAAADYIKKAFDFRGKVSDRERLYIAGHYYTDVTGNLDRAIETYELWTTLYPHDWGPFNNLANLYDLLGQPAKGLEYARAAAQISPNASLSTATLAQAYLELSDDSHLNLLCKDHAQAANTFISFHNICFLGAFSQGDELEMQRQLSWAKANPQESLLLGSVASSALAGGKLQAARQALSSARNNALTNHIPESVIMLKFSEAIADAEFGSSKEAVRITQETLPLAKNDVEAKVLAALILATSHQDESALRLATATSNEAPENDAAVKLGVPTVMAILALHQRHAAAAVAALEPSKPFLLFAPMQLEPAYTLGIAYLEDHQLSKAAATFEQILQNRGVAADSIYIGLSALALGRTLALENNFKGATRAYDEALRVWRDADPDFRPLKQARLERENALSAQRR